MSETLISDAVPRSRKDLVISLLRSPLSDRRFWWAQAMVAVVVLINLGAGFTQDRVVIFTPSFVWTLLLLVPVVYAGRTFGRVGSFATATPGIVALSSTELFLSHTGAELWGAWSILAMVIVTAILVGDRFEDQQAIAKAKTATEVSRALRTSEERFRLAFEGSMAPTVFSDQDGIFLAVNDAFCQMSGRTREELIGHDSKHFTYPEDIGASEEAYRRIITGEIDNVRYAKRIVHENGRIVVAEVSMCSARDESGKAIYFVSSVRDVTEERTLAAQLSHQALHDPLTGLPNRALLHDRLAAAYERAVRHGSRSALYMLDLDDFKGTNDTFGHQMGDQLLVAVAHRLEKVTRSSDSLCRFGGDEFVYVAERLTGETDAEEIVARLLGVFTEPFLVAGIAIEQRASIGVVVSDAASDKDYAELVQNADTAVYEAKRRGRGQYVLFTAAMSELVSDRFTLTQDLGNALTLNELSMHYQPIVDLGTGEIAGYEALMRWRHPERGWVTPDVFIPLAEQSDLIVKLGAFALGEATAAATSWDREFGILPPPVRGGQSLSPPVP